MEAESAVEVDSKSSRDIPAIAPNKKQGSRLADGSTFLPNIDGRSVWVRLVKGTLRKLQVHCGGEFTVPRAITARRVSVLEAVLSNMEENFALAYAEDQQPDPFQLELYGRLSDRQRRLNEVLGWERTARDVTPSPDEYLAQLPAEDPAPIDVVEEQPS